MREGKNRIGLPVNWFHFRKKKTQITFIWNIRICEEKFTGGEFWRKPHFREEGRHTERSSKVTRKPWQTTSQECPFQWANTATSC